MNDYDKVHAQRLKLSLDWLAPFITRDTRVLELGGETAFTQRLRALGATVVHSQGDLRYGDSRGENENCDIVLCMEVIEHVADQEPTKGEIADEWKGSGVLAMLRDAMGALRPGGKLFLTTPNACSITTIYKLLTHQPPMIYRPHVREYAVYELDEIVRRAGFRITKRETHDVWLNAIGRYEHRKIAEWMMEQGYSPQLRGEDIFLLAERPQ